MTDEQALYLKLIAYSIADDGSQIPDGIDAVNWTDYYRFCEEQAILGIGFQGIEKLKGQLGDGLKIPQELLLQWIGIVEQIKAQNKLLNTRTKELSEYLSANGKRSCILKGQGNALMFPNPLLRTPGDIDVWVEGSKKGVVRFVHDRYPDINVQYHHMDFPFFDDVECEVHYYPSFCYNKWHNRRLQQFFQNESTRQFANMTDAGFCVPSVPFNLVFQLSHMMRHFFTQGIGLRHAIDYYYLLKQPLTAQQKEKAVIMMKHCGMYKFFRAMMWIETEVMGLSADSLFVKPHARAGQMVLREMLKGGNFGRQNRHASRSMIGSYAKQMLYNMQYVCEFPSEPIARPFTLAWDYVYKRI